jgi:hypothetical protein
VKNTTTTTEVVEEFTDGVNTEIVRTISLSVTVGDSIQVRVRPKTGAARTPNWDKIMAWVTSVSGTQWTYDDTATLGNGVYCIERPL